MNKHLYMQLCKARTDTNHSSIPCKFRLIDPSLASDLKRNCMQQYWMKNMNPWCISIEWPPVLHGLEVAPSLPDWADCKLQAATLNLRQRCSFLNSDVLHEMVLSASELSWDRQAKIKMCPWTDKQTSKRKLVLQKEETSRAPRSRNSERASWHALLALQNQGPCMTPTPRLECCCAMLHAISLPLFLFDSCHAVIGMV